MELAPGTQVTESVRLVELLGQGGMGSVWVADHTELEMRVAVKFISTAAVQRQPALIERFKREARASAKIKSPHVVQVFDLGTTDDGTPYIVMELLEGESLAERLERDVVLGLRDTALIVAQVARVLGKAHSLGLIHRDIKPQNLFLESTEYELFVKVLDFGIAKQTELPSVKDLTATGAMVGTPEYLSPEQVRSSKDATKQADLWSLAVAAYRMLTGRMPFTGEHLGALCIGISTGVFPPPRQHRPDLPGEMDAWFAKAFALDHTQRFQSARELAESFVDIVDRHAAPQHGERRSRPEIRSDAGDGGPARRRLSDFVAADSSEYPIPYQSDSATEHIAITHPHGLANPSPSSQTAVITGENVALQAAASQSGPWPAHASQSGGWQAQPSASGAHAQQPSTFTGAAASLGDAGANEPPSRSRAPLVALLALLLVGAAAVGVFLVGGVGGDVHEETASATGLADSATAASDEAPTAPKSADVSFAAASTAAMPSAPPSASASAPVSASATSVPSASAPTAPPVVALRPPPVAGTARRPPPPRPPPPAAKPDCSKPYYFDSEGIKRIRTECL
jgi:serine/threonine-protein kinase